MLKWTVSRSLSAATSTTPHGPPKLNKTARRPFRDLSNTPPATGTKNRPLPSQPGENPTATRATPARRRRCRSHGSDLRIKDYFQTTKPNLRASKRQSMSQEENASSNTESFYQSTPRVDSDIGPLMFFPAGSKCARALTLPTDPTLFLQNKSNNFHSENELPQNIVNEARANLQSHVSDFFQQISLATSPEDVMEAESVPLKQRLYPANCQSRAKMLGYARSPQVPKLAKITKIHGRCKTPYHSKSSSSQAAASPFKLKGQPQNQSQGQSQAGHTPLLGKLSNLAIDQDLHEFENVQNTVTEVLNREQEKNFSGRTVAEILLDDLEERQKVLVEGSCSKACREEDQLEQTYETAEEQTLESSEAGYHNDSSVSSASQLLEDPSPISWAFASPAQEPEGEFTLKRQRGIRRKRHRKDMEKTCEEKRAKTSSSDTPPGKFTVENSAETESQGLAEAINPHVKKLALETDLDSTLDEDKWNFPSEKRSFCTFEDRKEDDLARKAATTSSWELESPKSSITDDMHSSKSFFTSVSNTPEAPLLATVRRCLKFSPESEPARSSSRGSIEIEYSLVGDCIHVRVIRCKDLRRTYEGPIHAYVKVSLKNNSGEGVVKRTAVHKATPNPVFHETLILPCSFFNDHCTSKPASLDIAVWHRDRRARRSELLGCMTLPLPLSQDKEATWHPLEAGTGRNSSTTPYVGLPQECGVSPPLSKDGEPDNNNSGGPDDLTYLRHLELEPLDPLTGLPLHPGFTARGGRTPCTVTRRLIRQTTVNQVPWGFSLSWGRPPRVERVDPGSPAERSGLKPGDYVVFVETTNVVTRARDEILGLIQAATNQLVLEVYRKGGIQSSVQQRPTSMCVNLQQPIVPGQQTVTFSAEVFPNLAPDAPPEEELTVRETRYWGILKSGHTRFMAPLAERRDVLAAADYIILFQNLDELLKLSEEIRDEGGGIDSYLCRVPRLTAAYRRYLSGLQRACCLLVALRRNSAFAKLVCEPAVPQKKRPDLTGILLLPLEHYREMTRLLGQASPRNCQQARDLAQGYREATANAGVMEPPRDTGRPLLSLQEVESRLVFARCKPFTLAMPGRQWLFGGALAKVEARGRLQPTWALLLTDLLVFARVSRDRVLFVTEEPLRLSNIAEACFTVRKRPTEFRLQVSVNTNGNAENGNAEIANSGGCSPHSRPRRRLIVLRAPSPELKAVWHNLLQRQIIYVNTGYGGTPNPDSPEETPNNLSHFPVVRDAIENSPIMRDSLQQPDEEKESHSAESLERILKSTRENNHLAQWVRNSHQIPPPDQDQESSLEEWTAEELAARAPRESNNSGHGLLGDSRAVPVAVAVAAAAAAVSTAPVHVPEELPTEVLNSDIEQQSTASSASLSTVKSNSLSGRKNELLSHVSSRENSSSSISICRRCHRSGCPTSPLARDPFSPVPPRISVVPPTPDLCTRHRLRNGSSDSPGRNSPSYTPADGNTEDGSEDDLDCDGEPPYRALRRFGTMSSLDQDDDLDDQGEEDNRDTDSPPLPLSEGVGGYLLQPPVPPERTEFSLEANDEEGTTSGATSGDDIWGTPTSGGPDDESFTANSPPPQPPQPTTNGASADVSAGIAGEDNYGLNLSVDDDCDQESENDDCTELPELSMDQLLGSGSLSSLRCFLSRRRLEPLPEEDDSPGSGKQQVGWW